MRKLWFIIGALVVISAVSYYGYHSYSQSQIKQTQTIATADKYTEYDKNMAEMKWLQRYPQLKTVASGSMTATIDKLRTSESISELIGPIDNAYGVRNDILDKILSIVPESNPQMLKAAIMSAYYDNLSSYSRNDDSKLENYRKFALAGHCLILLDDKTNYIYRQSIGNIANKMRDTPLRKTYMDNLDQTTFAWQTIGSGLAQSEEDELCQKGNY